MNNIRNSLVQNLESFMQMSPEEIFNQRKNKFLRIGRKKGFMTNLEEISSLSHQNDGFNKIIKSKRNLFYLGIFLSILAVSLIFIL
jgi:acetyl-CoA carboxylase carboxyl transferase subunit alpha